jgi:hypothetical protein
MLENYLAAPIYYLISTDVHQGCPFSFYFLLLIGFAFRDTTDIIDQLFVFDQLIANCKDFVWSDSNIFF